jgi:predicted O-linked N-acetylglucosamine transferase (SPINDLY family)
MSDWQSGAMVGLMDNEAAAWYALARSYKELGKLESALACYRRALCSDPHDAAILTSYGTALYLVGRRNEAIAVFREALAYHPDHTGARASLEYALPSAPGDMTRLAQLRREAQRLQQTGRLPEALELHHQAIQLAPRAAGIWLSTGLLVNELGDQPESLPFFEEAARLDPALAAAVEAARRICVGAGLLEKAAKYSAQALAHRPSDEIRLAQALTLAAIPPSGHSIDAARAAYERVLDGALGEDLRIEDLYATNCVGGFFLAYHGRNDRKLQEKAANFLLRAFPGLSMTAAHCRNARSHRGKIRIGFISRFFNDHSIGKTSRGLVTELSRDSFEIIVLRIMPSKSDEITALICAAADRAVTLDPDFRTAREQVAGLELDILFYQDIGMEPTSYLMAFSRLAPVQCVSFGHPNTTGIPTMDYFVSNDLFEPPNAALHYRESLFLLQDLPTLAYYYRPEASIGGIDRKDFGLDDQDHVYLCPQVLFKLHPDFDGIVAGILRRDPRGVVVLIRGQYPDYDAQIRARFAHGLPDVAKRILMLDRMGSRRFQALLASANVCLDTLHFNGMNSSLEAFAVGTPIVTLPGALQRGRHTQAMYRKMGILECIAKDMNDYVAIAVRLGCDKAYAAGLRARILAANGVLYENSRVVAEFERFFLEAVARAG